LNFPLGPLLAHLLLLILCSTLNLLLLLLMMMHMLQPHQLSERL
jgi:hypothetical protein